MSGRSPGQGRQGLPPETLPVRLLALPVAQREAADFHRDQVWLKKLQ